MGSVKSEYDELHKEQEQLRRQKSALKLIMDSVDNINQTGIIKDYEVSLNDCTCRDYFVRRLPCKHMYCLAIALGIFQVSDKVHNTNLKSSSYEMDRRAECEPVKDKVRKLSKESQKILQECVSLHEKFFPLDVKLYIDELVTAGLVTTREIVFLDVASHFTIADILKECINEKPLKKNRRDPVMRFFAEHYSERANQLVHELSNDRLRVDLTEAVEKNLVAIQRMLAQILGRVYVQDFDADGNYNPKVVREGESIVSFDISLEKIFDKLHCNDRKENF